MSPVDNKGPLDVNALSLTGTARLERARTRPSRPPRHRPGERFLKGPIPLGWLIRAAGLPGKALQVALAIWYRAGVERTGSITLTTTLTQTFNVDRYAKRRALAALEKAKLVTVQRTDGRNPQVTILDVENPEK